MQKKLKLIPLILLFLLMGCQPSEYILNFYHHDGSLIESIIVEEGQSVSPPSHENLVGKKFIGWNHDLDSLTSDLNIFPLFEVLTYQVTFLDISGELYKQFEVNHGDYLDFPKVPFLEGYEIIGWSEDDNLITNDLVIKPIYEKISLTLTLVDSSNELIKELEFAYGKIINDLSDYEPSNEYYHEWFQATTQPPIEFPFALTKNISLTRISHSKNLHFKEYSNGYEVSAGTNQDTHLKIPMFFNNKPIVKISDFGFRYSLIKSLYIPSTVIEVGVRAFEGALMLEEINFAENSNLKTLKWDAFAYNQSLVHVNLPEGLEHLEQGVFYNSNNLVSVNLPRTLRTIGPYALTHNQKLEAINVDDRNRQFVSQEGVLYTNNFETLLIYPSGLKQKSFVVNENTKIIHSGAFDGSSLEIIYLSPNLREIKPFGLVGPNLRELVFSEGINSNLKTSENSLFNISSALTVYVNTDSHNDIEILNSMLLFNQNLNIKNLTERVILSEEITLNLIKNTWIVRSDILKEENIKVFRDWNSVTIDDYVYTYFYLKDNGSLDLVFKFSPSQNQRIQITFNEETRTLDLSNNPFEYQWGVIDQITKGHHNIIFKYSDATSSDIGLTEIILKGSSVDNGAGITDINSSQMPASLHLWPQVPNSYGDIEWLYSEIVVEEDNDILHTYFVANGFAQGYFGIQTNTTNFDERWVLFSIWSPFDTDDPSKIPDDLKVRLIRAGEGVEIREFGNEGSGGQSFLKYPWVVGNRYGFLTRVKPSGDNTTQYTAYFYDFYNDQWFLIASFERPQTNTYARGWYQFLEVYTENYGNLERTGHYGNYWVKNTQGEWFSVNRVLLTATDNARRGIRNDIDAGLSHYDGMIYLTTGGFKVSPVDIDSYIVISSINNKPNIDFDALP